MATTPQHCPGWEPNLKVFKCKCPDCSEEVEIFSDEFDRAHNCKKCGKEIDFTQCTLEGGA